MIPVFEGYSQDQEDVPKAVPGDAAIYDDTKGNNNVKKSVFFCTSRTNQY